MRFFINLNNRCYWYKIIKNIVEVVKNIIVYSEMKIYCGDINEKYGLWKI